MFYVNIQSNDCIIKYSSYLLLVHLIGFLLFDLENQKNDQHSSVEDSLGDSVKININNELHEDFPIPFFLRAYPDFLLHKQLDLKTEEACIKTQNT